MEKIVRLANRMDECAKVVSYACLLGSGFAVLVGVYTGISTVFGNRISFLTTAMAIHIGNIRVELSPEFVPEYVPSYEFACKRLFYGVLFLAIYLMMISYMAKIVRKILEPVKEARPFDMQVYKNMKKLGIWVLIQGVVWEITKAVIEVMTIGTYNIPALFDSEKIAGYSLEFSFNPTFLITAAVIFLLSYIFKYGAVLQTLSDETI